MTGNYNSTVHVFWRLHVISLGHLNIQFLISPGEEDFQRHPMIYYLLLAIVYFNFRFDIYNNVYSIYVQCIWYKEGLDFPPCS